MKISVAMDAALVFYCCCRQAERSVHYALSCPTKWAEFVAYYDAGKSAPINESIALLKELGADSGEACSYRSASQNPVLATVTLLLRWVTNRFKKQRAFSREDLSFICAKLEHLLRVLKYTEFPDRSELLKLRQDFCECEWIIEGKLIGRPELARAANIEHFFQSDYVEHVTLEQMGVRASLNGKSTSKLVSS